MVRRGVQVHDKEARNAQQITERERDDGESPLYATHFPCARRSHNQLAAAHSSLALAFSASSVSIVTVALRGRQQCPQHQISGSSNGIHPLKYETDHPLSARALLIRAHSDSQSDPSSGTITSQIWSSETDSGVLEALHFVIWLSAGKWLRNGKLKAAMRQWRPAARAPRRKRRHRCISQVHSAELPPFLVSSDALELTSAQILWLDTNCSPHEKRSHEPMRSPRRARQRQRWSWTRMRSGRGQYWQRDIVVSAVVKQHRGCRLSLWLSGRIGEAIDLYLDLARVYKRFPHVHFKLGYLFLTLQDFQSAVRHFSIEIERYSTSVSASESPSKMVVGDNAESRIESSDRQQAVEMSASHHSELFAAKQGGIQERTFLFCACLGRSEAYSALKEDVDAENDLLFVSNRGGSAKQILISMGVLFSHFGMHLRAEGCFERCSAMDGRDPDYLIAHAELRLAQKRYANAEKMFETCRSECSASSVTYHRALVGEGVALLRQNKLQEAGILLLQAMHKLRACTRSTKDRANATNESYSAGMGSLLSPPSSLLSSDEQRQTLVILYHEATNVYGGLCLLKGELQAALDTYYSVMQSSSSTWEASSSNPYEHFQLPMICVLPGTRTHRGDLVDTTKLSTKNLGEVLRHLDEAELRYGPDPCLYFHRANVHRALGEFEHFVHDLSLVESMDPEFLKVYSRREFFGDFLDLETISWIPLQFIGAIHGSLERQEYAIPSPADTPSSSSKTATKSRLSPRDRLPNASKANKAAEKGAMKKTRQLPLISEYALFQYFQERIKYGATLDEYAHVYQLDVFRRLPESRRKTHLHRLATQHLSPWEGVVLDETTPKMSRNEAVSRGERENPVRELTKSVLSKFGGHPCVHMVAGMIELELLNASLAHIYFTEAINLINKQSQAASTPTAPSSLVRRWQQRVMERAKFYCLIWRSMASRIKIEMEKAVEDLNLAAAIKLDERASGAVDDPLLLAQRTLIMLFNGHLKSAFKLLHQLSRDLKLVKKRRQEGKNGKTPSRDHELMLVIDMFGNSGLNSFSLLPSTVEEESSRRLSSLTTGDGGRSDDRNVNGDDDSDDEEKAAREEEQMAASIVRYALSKKTAGRTATFGSSVLQTETLDKFFEAGLVKLSSSGSIAQSTPFFQAILSIDESYLPPTNAASLELLKCKEQESMEEKLFNCFMRLGKRSKWLHKKVKWKFEAFIDANLAHAYLPSDVETLWHRARLLQDQKNYLSAITDLSGCLELMSSQISWERGKKNSSKVKAVFLNEAKRTHWLQLLLERGRLAMALEDWEKAIQDLTMVVTQAGKSNRLIEACAYEARSASLVHLNRYGHAIQDLQHLLEVSRTKKSTSSKNASAQDSNDAREDEDYLLNCILIGNLYCQLALDQMKVSATGVQKNAAVTPFRLEQLKTVHLNMGFIAKAEEYYDQVLKLSPEHFLVYYFRGRMLALSAQRKKAAECLGECLRRHPMFLPALFLRGCIYAQERLTILALADLYRVRHRAPSYPNLHTSIGFCHFDCGNMAKAVEALSEAVQQDPNDVDALYIRGCALQELLVLENAVKDFTRVLAINPEHFRALYQRSVCYVLCQKYRESVDDLDQAIKLQSEWKEAWTLHAYACFCYGRYEDAVMSYGKAIGLRDSFAADSASGPTLSQRDSQLFLHRAVANMYADHFPAALLDLDLALKRDHENYIAFVAKAFMLMKVGEYERAMQMLLHALPQHKKMRLMSPCDVLDSEREKALAKSHRGERSASLVMNPFTDVGFPSSSPPKAAQASEPAHTKITATAEAIFSFRKSVREEQEQHAQTNHQGRFTTVAKPSENDPSSSANPPRRISEAASQSPRKTLAEVSVAASPDPAAKADQLSALLQRRARNAKFMRAIKKLTFEHRVLKALESAASAKYKKNEQRARVLSDLMQRKSSIRWPKGTLTSNILVWAFNILGIYHLGKRQVDDALMAFSLAIQAHPYNATAYFNRGNVFLRTEALHAAVSGFQDAIEVEASCFQAYNNMGVALFRQKRLDSAHTAFAAGLHHVEDRKQKAILLYNLGVILQHMEKPDEAMEFYQQAIALDGSRTEFFNNRSSILHQQLKFTVALEDYNRALALGNATAESDGKSINPNIEAHLNRAQLFITMGSCTSAIKDLKVVLENLVMLQESNAKRSVVGNERGASSSAADSTADPSLQLESAHGGSADEALAEELLVFCEKWKDAMRIAVKDFLFGFDAFPCFAVFQLFALFGPQLGISKQAHAARESEDLHSWIVLPLPIVDSSYFDYERALKHWTYYRDGALGEDGDNQSNTLDDDEEQDEDVRKCKAELLQQPFGEYLREAMQKCQDGEFEDAARCLLRAHYKTTLDSPEEYFLIIWRVQVTMRFSSQPPDACLLRAIALLQEFLSERQHTEESGVCDDDPSGCNGTRKPKRLLLSRVSSLDDADHEELTEQELKWNHQRRVIRADAYTFLGNLHQLNGQREDAIEAFTHALRIRSDHAIALLNYLQLSIVAVEYEAALDCIIRMFELIFSRSGDSSDLSSLKDMKGLLNADRSVDAMLPTVPGVRADPELCRFGAQMLQLLKEYRLLLSAHIQSNTAHIFRKQGALAHLVEEIRQDLRRKEATHRSSRSPFNDSSGDMSSVLELEEFNRILDEYTASILQQSIENADDLSNQDLHSAFLTEFAHVCDQVTCSLPPDALPSKKHQRPAALDLGNDGTDGVAMTQASPKSVSSAVEPKSPGSAASRKTSSIPGARRPTATPQVSARPPYRKTPVANSSSLPPTTAPSASQNSQAMSPANAIRDSSSSRQQQLQPQRPQSGPDTLQRRQSRR